jgi:Mg-chelatase subunit ChlD
MSLRQFCKDGRGSVLPLFAATIIPVIGFIGAAVDYSRVSSARTEMQAALDATALMLSKEATGQNDTALSSKANAYFQQLFNRPEAQGITVTAKLATTGGSGILVNGTGSVPTTFSRLLGFAAVDFSGSSTVRWGSTKLQVALALDNTGSMASANKMANLKTAATQLLTTLQGAAATPGDINVAIVPFAREVNVGSGNYNADWIDWSDWEDANGSYVTSQTCTANRRGRPRSCTSNQVWQPRSHTTWNGCITDRDKPYDTQNAAPDPDDADKPEGATSTLFPAKQSDVCPAKLTTLTSNWATLTTAIANMQPNGNTNQAIGLAWAWHALSTGAPLNAPPKPADTRQIIILFSDGMNTENRWWTDQGSIDARQKITCENVKAAGITLYTVQVTTEGDPLSTMMKNCASPDDVEPKGPKFFFLTTGGQIVTTFNTIGTSLAKLRISN